MIGHLWRKITSSSRNTLLKWAGNRTTNAQILELICTVDDPDVISSALMNPSLDSKALERLAGHSNHIVRIGVAEHRNCSLVTLVNLTQDPEPDVARSALERLAVSEVPSYRMVAAKSQQTSRYTLNALREDPDLSVRIAATRTLELDVPADTPNPKDSRDNSTSQAIPAPPVDVPQSTASPSQPSLFSTPSAGVATELDLSAVNPTVLESQAEVDPEPNSSACSKLESTDEATPSIPALAPQDNLSLDSAEDAASKTGQSAEVDAPLDSNAVLKIKVDDLSAVPDQSLDSDKSEAAGSSVSLNTLGASAEPEVQDAEDHPADAHLETNIPEVPSLAPSEGPHTESAPSPDVEQLAASATTVETHAGVPEQLGDEIEMGFDPSPYDKPVTPQAINMSEFFQEELYAEPSTLDPDAAQESPENVETVPDLASNAESPVQSSYSTTDHHPSSDTPIEHDATAPSAAEPSSDYHSHPQKDSTVNDVSEFPTIPLWHESQPTTSPEPEATPRDFDWSADDLNGVDIFTILDSFDSDEQDSFVQGWDLASDPIEQRAELIADEIMRAAGWTEGHEALVASLNVRILGRRRVSILKQIEHGIDLEELKLALEFREYWREQWSESNGGMLSWQVTRELINGFSGYPDLVELQEFAEAAFRQYKLLAGRPLNFGLYMWNLLGPAAVRQHGKFDAIRFYVEHGLT